MFNFWFFFQFIQFYLLLFFVNFNITNGFACFYHFPSKVICNPALDVLEVRWKMRETKKKLKNCGADAAKQFNLWCGCGETGQKLSFATTWKKIIQHVGLLFAYILYFSGIFWVTGKPERALESLKKMQKNLPWQVVAWMQQNSLSCSVNAAKLGRNKFLPRKKN